MDKETVVMLVTGSELMGAERIREELFKPGFRVIAVETSSLFQYGYSTRLEKSILIELGKEVTHE